MSVAAFRLRSFCKPISILLRGTKQETLRLTRLHSAYESPRRFCNVAFKSELPIDNTTLDKCVEDITKDPRSQENRELASLFDKRLQLVKNISSLNSFNAGDEDEELKKLCEEENQHYHAMLDELNSKILYQYYFSIFGTHLNDDSLILEISAGVGGQEAMLFAGELFRMYELYAQSQGWEVEVIDASYSDLGGIKNSSALVRGSGVYRILRCEGGVHRVQRVPTTDRSARLHTSTATVVVMPEPSEIDVRIDEKDLRIEVKRPSGPGGQNAQKSDSSVRITHIPTGVVCSSQEHRTQTKNVKVAMTLLRTRLYALNYGKQEADVESSRRLQEGSRMRSEKIRTYNVLQDRVTDHRWGITMHSLPELWNGGAPLKNLIQQCGEHYEDKLYKDYVLSLKSALFKKQNRR